MSDDIYSPPVTPKFITLNYHYPVERKEEMCIPNIPLEEEEKTFYAETELAYLLSEDVMKEIYKEEMFQQLEKGVQDVMKEIYKEEKFQQLEKDVQEEESLVVISQFVREMCDYYKIAQPDYVMWQHYYNYLKEELVESKAQTDLNEEMKKHVEEMKLLEEESNRPPAIKFIGDEMVLWEALEKHK